MKRVLVQALIAILFLVSCGSASPVASPTTPPATVASPTAAAPIYRDPSQPLAARVEDLLARMNLDEKIGQMTQVEKNSIQPGDITRYAIGSLLSGGGGYPAGDNTPEGWRKMIQGFQEEALATRLAIPILYGVDAIHGHNNLYGATIFPQEIGLGASRDPVLVKEIGAATAEEILATGIPWTFSPVVAVPQDIRWGRTYESYSEDSALVSSLSTASIQGFQSLPAGYAPSLGQTLFTGATAKHFLGDGGTTFGTSNQSAFGKPYLLDQGDMRYDEAAVRTLFLPPYQSAVDAGVMSVMVSYSSWNGTKMHANQHMITDVLKGELGFQGFVVSDWGGMDQIDPDYYKAIVTGINAGIDMNMVPSDYVKFISTLKKAVSAGDVPQARIDDAVRRILRAKFELGLFDHPVPDPALLSTIRSPSHLALARQAVRESLVLLKNDKNTLPVAKNTASIFVAGRGADDMGMQCGGWTIEWQGQEGRIDPGTTILEAIQAAVPSTTSVTYKMNGEFQGHAQVGIAVIGESPYAEGVGDRFWLDLDPVDVAAVKQTRAHVDQLIVVLVTGRPLVITDLYPSVDAWVVAWLPGTEGAGVTDVLFGDYPFVGKLPYSWPRSNDQLPINEMNAAGKTGCQGPLFPFSYGLGQAGSQPIQPVTCP